MRISGTEPSSDNFWITCVWLCISASSTELWWHPKSAPEGVRRLHLLPQILKYQRIRCLVCGERFFYSHIHMFFLLSFSSLSSSQLIISWNSLFDSIIGLTKLRRIRKCISAALKKKKSFSILYSLKLKDYSLKFIILWNSKNNLWLIMFA